MMFKSLADRLSHSLKQITGQAKLSEDNIQETLRQVRLALLEADVALPVVKAFIDQVKTAALGVAVSQALNPGQQFLKIVHAQLQAVMGQSNERLQLAVQPPAVILLAGLQGAGKTTCAAKLAHFLQQRENKKVMLVSADVYRPAAIDQLQTLAQQIDAAFFASHAQQSPQTIVTDAIAAAKTAYADVLIVDTAGRLAIDEAMMAEIKALHQIAQPIETLFVVDAMSGQDAANTAQAFNEALALTGVILTKADGDARGGAALSVRHITGKPIKFLGMGEKIDALEPFYPDRIASRILDMGDMLSLIEEMERKVDQDVAQRLAKKIKKGKGFDLEDFRAQLQQMHNMGGMGSFLEKLPGMGQMQQQMAQASLNDKMLVHMEALINSMTPDERRFPDKLNGSRKRRVSQGAGLAIQDLNRLLKQYKQMQKMMKKISGKGGMQKMMRGLQGMMGNQGLPPMR